MSPLQILSILWRRLWIVILTFAATMVGAGLVMRLVPPRYDAVATASIDPGQTDPVTQLPVFGNAMRILQGNFVSLVKSRRVAVMVVKRLNLLANPSLVAQFRASDAVGRLDVTEWIADDLLGRLDASFPEGTNILTIKYKSNSGTSAAQIANAFLAAFIDAAVEMKIDTAQQTAQWFEPQTGKLRVELDAARERLTKFQRDSQLLALGGGTADPESDPLHSVTSELTNAKAQLLKLQIALQSSAAKPVDDSIGADNLDSTVMTTFKGQLHTINTDIAKLRSEVGANNPKLLALLSARKSVETQLRTEAASNREQMIARAKILKDQIESLEKARTDELQRMINLQAQRDQLGSLKMEVDVRRDQLLSATKSAGSSRLQSQLSLSNISVLDTATPPVTPAFPKFSIVMLAGVGAGLSLGIIFALLAEAFNRRIRVASDLEFAGKVPMLGTLQGTPRGRHWFARPPRRRAKRLPPKLQPASLPAKARA